MNRLNLCAVLSFVMLTSCTVSVLDDSGAVDQGLGTAWLFELDGASAGFVSSAASTTGGSACGSPTLRVTLGPNLSNQTRLWLDSALASNQAPHTVALYLANTNQRLELVGATVTSLELPRAQSDDGAQVFFTVTVTSMKSSSCSAVSPPLMAQKNQLAAGWAARPALAKSATVQVGKLQLDPPMRTTGYSWGPVSIEVGVGMGKAMYDWIQSSFDKKAVSFDGSVLEVQRDLAGAPLLGIRWYGSLSAGDAGVVDGGFVFTAKIDRAHLTAALPDGGVE
jgi:hypothetical protein